jgi:hypothetical protein
MLPGALRLACPTLGRGNRGAGTSERIWVAGRPITAEALDTTDDELMGLAIPSRRVIMLRSLTGDRTSRTRTSILHEILHIGNDMYRLGLTHDQVRRVSSLLTDTITDPRNRRKRTFAPLLNPRS